MDIIEKKVKITQSDYIKPKNNQIDSDEIDDDVLEYLNEVNS